MSDKIEDSSSLIHVVAFIDILGSSQILLSEDDNAINNYLAGIDGLNFWARNEENGTVMFSDNVLIYSEGNTAEAVQSIIQSVANVQIYIMKKYNLLIRGGVVIDELNHIPQDQSDYIIGKAIVRAYNLESRKAIYPRVVVSKEVYEKYFPIDEKELITNWDCPFVDFLQATIEEGFVNTDTLQQYRQCLIKHVEDQIKDVPVDSWDRIRDKDLWALSYYNEFCKNNDVPEMAIDFKEEYIPSFGKIVITIENKGGSDN